MHQGAPASYSKARLPLVLELAGRDAFLALSLALTTYLGLEATVSLAVRNTRLAFLGSLASSLTFAVIPGILLLLLKCVCAS